VKARRRAPSVLSATVTVRSPPITSYCFGLFCVFYWMSAGVQTKFRHKHMLHVFASRLECVLAVVLPAWGFSNCFILRNAISGDPRVIVRQSVRPPVQLLASLLQTLIDSLKLCDSGRFITSIFIGYFHVMKYVRCARSFGNCLLSFLEVTCFIVRVAGYLAEVWIGSLQNKPTELYCYTNCSMQCFDER